LTLRRKWLEYVEQTPPEHLCGRHTFIIPEEDKAPQGKSGRINFGSLRTYFLVQSLLQKKKNLIVLIWFCLSVGLVQRLHLQLYIVEQFSWAEPNIYVYHNVIFQGWCFGSFWNWVVSKFRWTGLTFSLCSYIVTWTQANKCLQCVQYMTTSREKLWSVVIGICSTWNTSEE